LRSIPEGENRLASVTVGEQTTQFIYDGDGNLVKKINHDESRTIYIGGLYEVYKDDNDIVTKTVTYYPAGGAMRIVDGTSNNLYYVLKDHLGSASVVTDASGVTVGEQRLRSVSLRRNTLYFRHDLYRQAVHPLGRLAQPCRDRSTRDAPS